jgi:hypothetical protein
MLVTYEEGWGAVKVYSFLLFALTPQAGWNSSPLSFSMELKTLKATDLSRPGPALKTCFDLLNLYRLHSGSDNYGLVSGYGALPFL